MNRVICEYLAFECGIRLLSPDSVIGTYLPGIIHIFDIKQIPSVFITIATKQPSFLLASRGFHNLYSMVHPKSSKIKIPFSTAAAKECYRLLCNGFINSHAGLLHMLSIPLFLF